MPGDRLIVECDPVRIVQVVGNLLTNAAKYTPAGDRIEISADRRQNFVVVAVSDDGVGIPQDALPYLFDMFSQVSRKLGRSQGDLGIGLSLVRLSSNSMAGL